MRVTSMPDIILKQQLSFRDGILLGIASGCWDEYIACRLSAFMGKGPVLSSLEDTFCAALDKAKERGDAAIRQYRMHGDATPHYEGSGRDIQGRDGLRSLYDGAHRRYRRQCDRIGSEGYRYAGAKSLLQAAINSAPCTAPTGRGKGWIFTNL